MRIALNIEKVGARYGGAEKYVGMLARSLAAVGHDVHVAARVIDSGELSPGITCEIIRLSGPFQNGFMRPWSFARASAESLRRQDFDLVVGFNKALYLDVYIALAGAHPASIEYNKRRFRSSIARTLWSIGKAVNPTQWTYRRIDARLFVPGGSPFVVAPSAMVAEHFRRFHNVPAERIVVVPNGIEGPALLPDAAARRKRFRGLCGLSDDEIAVLFVARNYALKGLEPLLHAFAPVAHRNPHARLIVCGSDRSARFQRAAQRLGIERQAVFVGSVDDPRDCFAGGDVFVHPSFYDPGSLVVPEAQAAGLPVITTRQNGAGELLTEGVDGFVIDSPWALDDLTERIERLVVDSELRRRMSDAALAGAPRHALDRRMPQMLEELKRIDGLTRRQFGKQAA